jgi:hypothetical protein
MRQQVWGVKTKIQHPPKTLVSEMKMKGLQMKTKGRHGMVGGRGWLG